MYDGSVIVDERNPHLLCPSLGGIAERLANAWKNGIAPVAGALLQQPARAMALIRVWESAWNGCEGRKFDAAKEKAARNGGN
jgi:hypothetical protein